jgi:predicted DNA binding protein
VSPESWIGSLCSKDSAKIKVLSMKLDDSKRNITHFVDITSEKKNAKDLMRQLRKSDSVTENNVTSLGKNRVVGAVTSNNCKVGLIMMKSRSNRKTGFLGIAQAVAMTDSRMIYKVFMNGEMIPRFLQSLREGSISYKISEIEKLAAPKAITTKQKLLLKTALELGYYDNPKRISEEDLSITLGLTVSAVSQTLRIAERKIIKAYSETVKPVQKEN